MLEVNQNGRSVPEETKEFIDTLKSIFPLFSWEKRLEENKKVSKKSLILCMSFKIIKKNRRPVSRVLFFILSFIWDCCHQQPLAAYPLRHLVLLPEPNPGRIALCSKKHVIYLALQSMRHTANDVAITTGGLLPHLFTLIPVYTETVIFCYTTVNLHPPFR